MADPISYSTVEEFKAENGYVIDGAWYPRVTKIVGIKAKPALYRYYGNAPDFRTAQQATERSAEEGTRVHEAAEAILLGREPEGFPFYLKPSIEAFAEFLAKTPMKTSVAFVERRVLHADERYAGTVDALAEIGGKFGVLDIKTSQGIYRDYNLQTAAYMDALRHEFSNLETRWILRIDQAQSCLRCGALRRLKGGQERVRRNGSPLCSRHDWGPVAGVVELKEFPHWQGDFEAFLGAKKLWEWEHEDWLRQVGYLV